MKIGHHFLDAVQVKVPVSSSFGSDKELNYVHLQNKNEMKPFYLLTTEAAKFAILFKYVLGVNIVSKERQCGSLQSIP